MIYPHLYFIEYSIHFIQNVHSITPPAKLCYVTIAFNQLAHSQLFTISVVQDKHISVWASILPVKQQEITTIQGTEKE